MLTVEQAAVLMQRYLKDKLTADANAALPESAGAVSSWARDGVAWAYGARLLDKDDLSAPAEAARPRAACAAAAPQHELTFNKRNAF